MSQNPIRDKFALIDRIESGDRPKYLVYQPNRDGTIGKTCFSQWFEVGTDRESK